MPSPTDSFVAHNAEALRRARALVAFLEDHQGVSPEQVDWGHVGSAEKAARDLQEACCFLQVGPE